MASLITALYAGQLPSSGGERRMLRLATTGLRPLRTDLLRILYRSSSQAKTTLEDQPIVSGASFLSCRASPQRRKYSIVRAETVLARGRSQLTSGRGSIAAQATSCQLSSMAAASPTGPPPAMRTGTRAGGAVAGRSARCWSMIPAFLPDGGPGESSLIFFRKGVGIRRGAASYT